MTKAKQTLDPEREKRIDMRIVVDAYDEQERAMGWYYYLQDHLQPPFKATCIEKRPISPLRIDDKIEVIGMADEEECEHEVFVTIRWKGEDLAVPLSQLELASATDKQTKQAVEDWHYWVGMGYTY